MDNSSSNRTTITRDMLLKDMLQDPVVKRKKKGSSYKVLDNRDSLPFQVEIASPDPYTPKEKKQKNINRVKRIPNAVENTIQSKLYMEEGDDAHQTPLGDYLLDKHTTTGDLLEIQGTRYKVVRHKCQYKVRSCCGYRLWRAEGVGRRSARHNTCRYFSTPTHPFHSFITVCWRQTLCHGA